MTYEIDIREAAADLCIPRLVLSLIVPVKDEEESIPLFLDRVVNVVTGLDDEAANSFEILFIDDGSTDRTFELLKDANAAY